MNKLNRELPDKWQQGTLTWSAHFDDLRPAASIPGERQKILLRELKTLALFKPYTLIRDAAVINSLELQDWIVNDHAYIRSAFHTGALVIGLRQDRESLPQLHEHTGRNRAYPERYEDCKFGGSEVQRYLEELSVNGAIAPQQGRPAHPCVVDLPVGPSDLFEEGLGRVHNHLTTHDSDLLKTAIEVAKYRGGAPLRFGHIHDYLVQERSLARDSELIQLCKTAHVLAVPGALKLPIASADGDIDLWRACKVMGASPREARDPERLQELWPAQILTLNALDNLDFQMIAARRLEGERLGYFDAVANLHAGLWSDDCESKYVRFLELLAEYLIAIGGAKVELIPKAKALAKAKLDRDERVAKRWLWGVPVAAGIASGVVGAVVTLVTLNPVPLALASLAVGFGGGNVLGGVLERSREWWREGHKPPLQRMLEDTLAFAPHS
jgi:hypothetical protein